MSALAFRAGGAFVVIAGLTTGSIFARDLGFEQRVAAQRAVEEVYWRHRIWPKNNPRPKPPLEEILPERSIIRKVEDVLKESAALERLWGRPITAAQLQAEMERMARDTRRPGVLRELFAALGDDPRLIAECLARPILADRLARSWYASDERFHGEMRRRAEEAMVLDPGLEGMGRWGGRYTETTWRLGPVCSRSDGGTTEAMEAVHGGGQVTTPGEDRLTVCLAADEWPRTLERLGGRLGVARIADAGSDAPPFPLGRPGPLVEDEDSFSVTAVLSRTEDSVRTATVVWPKESFDTWWERERGALPSEVAEEEQAYSAVTPLSPSSCVDDTWAPTNHDMPEGRAHHTAIWTGSEMIVWGGCYGGCFNSGGRYDPATGTWRATSVGENVPREREDPSVVWTGAEMIVWGGWTGSNTYEYPIEGGRYNPATNIWLPTSTGPGVPTGRRNQNAVWSGTEMIVWGGHEPPGGAYVNTGARYNPSIDTWTPTSTGPNVPTPRSYHTAVWSGPEMIVWGGNDDTVYFNTGGRYNPSTDTWTATSIGTGVPTPRSAHTAVWTGSEMIVWGGASATFNATNTGARYNPSTDSWMPTSTGAGVPAARNTHTAVWLGGRMIVWGGFDITGTNRLNTGGRYNPTNNTWLPTSTGANVPSARSWHTAVATSTEMIVWGGQSFNALGDDSGGRYNPSTDSWVRTAVTAPSVRKIHKAVWTGAEMIVWGGYNDVLTLNTGGRYDPSTDSWRLTSTGTGVPSARADHTAVWTGLRMIVWGGSNNGGITNFNTGSRYDPSTDTWSPTSTGSNVPSGRSVHSAVWTGSEMIVWGGYTSAGDTNTGGRYNPTTDHWTPTSTGAGVPDLRDGHTAVWTGSEMIVWGGYNDFTAYQNSGGRYRPAQDSWTPTSTGANVPTGRDRHTAVWTGSEMIVWGGTNSGGASTFDTGGRYDPAADSWKPTSTANVPEKRIDHVSVWTGSEMIVWGGSGSNFFNTGGRYSPATDAWRPTGTGAGVPSPREFLDAVWTGDRMIVWGGNDTNTGGLYCATICAAPSGIPSVLVDPGPAGAAHLSWSPVAGASVYDVVRGSVTDLRATGGDFTSATHDCLADNTPATSLDDPALPGVGETFWYLIRALSCTAGTYDSGAPSQVGSRDAEIAASPGACP